MEQEIKSLKIRQVVGVFCFFFALKSTASSSRAASSEPIHSGRQGFISNTEGLWCEYRDFHSGFICECGLFVGGVLDVHCESSVTVRTLCKSLQFPRPPKIEVSFDLLGVNLGESQYMCPQKSSGAAARLWSHCAQCWVLNGGRIWTMGANRGLVLVLVRFKISSHSTLCKFLWMLDTISTGVYLVLAVRCRWSRCHISPWNRAKHH